MALRLPAFVDLTQDDEDEEPSNRRVVNNDDDITFVSSRIRADIVSNGWITQPFGGSYVAGLPGIYNRSMQHQIGRTADLLSASLSREQNYSPQRTTVLSGGKARSPSEQDVLHGTQPSLAETTSFTKVIQHTPPALEAKSQASRPIELRIRQALRPPQCYVCIESNVNCDGMRPCAFCEEPGFECAYPGQSPIQRPTVLRKTTGDMGPNTSREISFDTDDPPPQDPHRSPYVQDAETEPYNGLALCQDTSIQMSESEIRALEHVPNNNWVPASILDMSELVKAHQENLNMHREYVLQVQLLQAKRRAQLQPTVPREIEKPKLNPFRRLLDNGEGFQFRDQHLTTTKLQIKGHLGKKRPFATTELAVRSLPVDERVPLLPKYKSIGRMGTSFLSKNVHTLMYMPYFVDEESPDTTSTEKERNTELSERYRNRNFNVRDSGFLDELRQQRKCLERVWHWSEEFQRLLRELQLDLGKLSYWIMQTNPRKCPICGVTAKDMDLASPTTHITTGEAQMCEWLSIKFLEQTSIPVWHFLHQDDGIPSKKDIPAGEAPGAADPPLCSICFVYNCLTHGAYEDGDDEANRRGVFIDDPENENNLRKATSTKSQKRKDQHICGLFCFERRGGFNMALPAVFRAAVGLDEHDSMTGRWNQDVPMNMQLARYRDTAICTKQCFLQRKNRASWLGAHKAEAEAPKAAHKRLARSLVHLHSNNLRLPCMLAKMCKISCMLAFTLVLQVHLNPRHTEKQRIETVPTESHADKASRPAAIYNTDMSHMLDERSTILPCDHEGPCTLQSKCACAKSRVHCERFCGCELSCKRRFRGCRCSTGNPRGVCFKDDRCECYKNNRECDPWLCGTCGVLEVLDPPNKYRAEIRQGRCQNCMIQLDLPARTIKAPSEVQGWGLFAGEDLPKHAFIGEYKGEIISAGDGCESDRRGVVYHNGGLEYLFKTNNEQEIDGSCFGNKTRFMNNSKMSQHINIGSQKLIANSVQRVLFYAIKPIKAGEELLYDYNYPEAVTKTFWEKGEKPSSFGRGPKGSLMIPEKPKLSNRIARQAGAISAAGNEAESLPTRGRPRADDAKGNAKKRKRSMIADSEEDSAAFEIVDVDEEDGDEDNDQVGSQLQQDLTRIIRDRHARRERISDGNSRSSTKDAENGDDEDYEHEDSEVEDSEPEPDELDMSESDEDTTPPIRRRRSNPAKDGRYGGAAQRKAAATRRERLLQGGKY